MEKNDYHLFVNFFPRKKLKRAIFSHFYKILTLYQYKIWWAIIASKVVGKKYNKPYYLDFEFRNMRICESETSINIEKIKMN